MAMRPFPAGFRPRRRPGGGQIGPKLSLAITGPLTPGSAFTLTATVAGANPPVTALSAASVTVGGVSVTLSGTGLIRTGTIPEDAEEGLAIAAAASIEADGLTISGSATGEVVSGEVVTGAPGLTAFATDQMVYDVGAVLGRNTAILPLSGAGDDGKTVQARAVRASDGVAVMGWTTVGAVEGETWSGNLTGVPKTAQWLRVEVR